MSFIQYMIRTQKQFLRVYQVLSPSMGFNREHVFSELNVLRKKKEKKTRFLNTFVAAHVKRKNSPSSLKAEEFRPFDMYKLCKAYFYQRNVTAEAWWIQRQSGRCDTEGGFVIIRIMNGNQAAEVSFQAFVIFRDIHSIPNTG